MRIEKAMDIALLIMVDHGGPQIGYDKLFFLFRQKLPSADSKMFDEVIELLKNNKYIAFGKSKQNTDKIYLTSSGIKLYIDGGAYQNLLFVKAKKAFWIALVLGTGLTCYYLW